MVGGLVARVRRARICFTRGQNHHAPPTITDDLAREPKRDGTHSIYAYLFLPPEPQYPSRSLSRARSFSLAAIFFHAPAARSRYLPTPHAASTVAHFTLLLGEAPVARSFHPLSSRVNVRPMFPGLRSHSRRARIRVLEHTLAHALSLSLSLQPTVRLSSLRPLSHARSLSRTRNTWPSRSRPVVGNAERGNAVRAHESHGTLDGIKRAPPSLSRSHSLSRPFVARDDARCTTARSTRRTRTYVRTHARLSSRCART